MIGVGEGGKRGLKTYGEKRAQDIFDFKGSSDGEDDVFERRVLGSGGRVRRTEDVHGGKKRKGGARDNACHEGKGTQEDELHGNANEAVSHPSNGDRQDKNGVTLSLHSSMLPPTLPHGLPPEPSTVSTVPFTSSAYSTPKETGSFEGHLSDDRMPTPTVSSKSRSDAEKPASSGHTSVKPQRQSHTEVEELSPSFEKLSPPESRESSRPSKCGRTEEDSDVLPSMRENGVIEEVTTQRGQTHVLPSMVDTLIQSLPYTADRVAIEKILAECGGNINLAASRLLDAIEQAGGHDELSFPTSSVAVSSAKRRSFKADKNQTQQHQNHKDELGSDDINIGLPKEQYQPRPSRSRSGQAEKDELVVPVDFSKRPEALGKAKKSKRRKTTALAKASPKYEEEDEEEDEEVVQLFNATKCTKSTETDSKSTVDTTKPAKIEMEETNQDTRSDCDAAKHPAPKKQRGRPQKQANEVPEEQQPLDNLDGDPIADLVEEPPMKEPPIVSKPKKQRGRPQKKPVDTSEEPIFVDSEEEEPNEDPAEGNGNSNGEAKSAAKKQRGRPKKSAPKVSEDLDSNHEDPLASPKKSHKPKPSGTTSEPPILNGDHPETPQSLPDTAQKEPLTETQPKSPNKPPPVPSTPNKPKGPDKHSPLQSSKVRYRVGLSKRARIEPLLRVVRK